MVGDSHSISADSHTVKVSTLPLLATNTTSLQRLVSRMETRFWMSDVVLEDLPEKSHDSLGAMLLVSTTTITRLIGLHIMLRRQSFLPSKHSSREISCKCLSLMRLSTSKFPTIFSKYILTRQCLRNRSHCPRTIPGRNL